MGPDHQKIFPQKRPSANSVCQSAQHENDVPSFRGDFRVAEFFNRTSPNLPVIVMPDFVGAADTKGGDPSQGLSFNQSSRFPRYGRQARRDQPLDTC